MGTKRIAIVMAMVCIMAIGSSMAWNAKGYIYCDVNENGEIDDYDTALPGVTVFVNSMSPAFSGSATSEADGYFSIQILDTPAIYIETLDPSTLPADAVIVVPGGGEYAIDTSDGQSAWRKWLINSAVCRDGDEPFGECWMTGGGVKFNPTAGMPLAENGPHHSMGGNVFPGCNGDTGAEGGHWNHVAHKLKLHFKANPIDGRECGNVDGIPPGSESPVTPFNFIRYWGTGTLKGIKGNKVDHGTVYFTAYVEDRNEPGNQQSNSDGADVDRYFLHVFADAGDPSGTTLLLIDMDGDGATEDPVLITGGNLQLHDNPCD